MATMFQVRKEDAMEEDLKAWGSVSISAGWHTPSLCLSIMHF